MAAFLRGGRCGWRELSVSYINQHGHGLVEMLLQQMSEELLCLDILQHDPFILDICSIT